MATNSDIFISYASDTKPLAEELTTALQSQGIQAWVDFKDLRPGQRWKDELERAIEKAHWVLFLIRPNSRATALQEAEWSAVLTNAWADSEKKLLPVVVGGTEPPPFLRNWVAITVDPETEPATWTRHVLDALRSTRNGIVHDLTPRDRRERDERLTEIGKAAAELRKRQLDEPTTGEAQR